MDNNTYFKRLLVTIAVAGSAAAGAWGISDAVADRREEKRCAAIAERTTSQTDYYQDICWVDINSDIPGISPNWQPEEWLR